MENHEFLFGPICSPKLSICGMITRGILLTALISTQISMAGFAQEGTYRDASLQPSERTQLLIKEMTLEEKVAQMLSVWQQRDPLFLDESGEVDHAKMKNAFPHGLGQIARPSDSRGGLSPEKTVEFTNKLQRYFIEETRLGIPVIFHEEALHGHAAKGATSFPQPIGLASTFNPELIEKIFTSIAHEVRVRGGHQVLTPVVDVAREPRWGRVEETYGEDPFLSSRIGYAAVKGFQGDNSFQNKSRVFATLKHMAGHGQPENGNNISPANISERVLREIFLYPFRYIVENANVSSIMASYNEVDGVPSHANTWMMQNILRGEWNFKGYVVSDYYALRELNDRPGLFGHGVAETTEDAAVLGVKAGINIELPDTDVYPVLGDLVKSGKLQESELDALIAPMLLYKFKMGLFDDPYLDPEKAGEIVGRQEHVALALQAAEETITLLQNKNDILPLNDKKVKHIAVIGPNADRELLGGYSGEPPYFVTVREGIEKRVRKRSKVYYAEGVKITTTSGWRNDEVELASAEDDRKGIQEAVDIAKGADVIILALGGNEQTSREAWAKNHMGDRTDLQMVGRQDELVDALSKLDKPMIACLFNGRPLAVTNLLEKADAVLECWYLGQESGNAVANVIFGDVNPSGKLAISMPRSVGHIPAYYNYKPSARRGYLFDEVSALFPFGFGLSYTSFEMENLELDKSSMAVGDSAQISVNVTNTGNRDGATVVQLYVRDKFSSVTRPVKELKGFQKVFLEPGASKQVSFTVSEDALAFYDIHMNYVVEPGEFELMLGFSSDDNDLETISLTVE